MTENGEDCPSPNIITTDEGCKLAAEELGLTYGIEVLTEDEYPAGCYFSASEANFNPQIDPVETHQTLEYGGVCMGRYIY